MYIRKIFIIFNIFFLLVFNIISGIYYYRYHNSFFLNLQQLLINIENKNNDQIHKIERLREFFDGQIINFIGIKKTADLEQNQKIIYQDYSSLIEKHLKNKDFIQNHFSLLQNLDNYYQVQKFVNEMNQILKKYNDQFLQIEFKAQKFLIDLRCFLQIFFEKQLLPNLLKIRNFFLKQIYIKYWSKNFRNYKQMFNICLLYPSHPLFDDLNDFFIDVNTFLITNYTFIFQNYTLPDIQQKLFMKVQKKINLMCKILESKHAQFHFFNSSYFN